VTVALITLMFATVFNSSVVTVIVTEFNMLLKLEWRAFMGPSWHLTLGMSPKTVVFALA
jgi:hypothetical protein